jgi:5,6-dimethylbenzimidazole synthase
VPDLEKYQWLTRLGLQDVVFFEKWNDSDNPNWNMFKNFDP